MVSPYAYFTTRYILLDDLICQAQIHSSFPSQTFTFAMFPLGNPKCTLNEGKHISLCKPIGKFYLLYIWLWTMTCCCRSWNNKVNNWSGLQPIQLCQARPYRTPLTLPLKFLIKFKKKFNGLNCFSSLYPAPFSLHFWKWLRWKRDRTVQKQYAQINWKQNQGKHFCSLYLILCAIIIFDLPLIDFLFLTFHMGASYGKLHYKMNLIERNSWRIYVHWKNPTG